MNPQLPVSSTFGGLPSAESLRAYVRAWKALKDMSPSTRLSRGFADPWPTTAGDELKAFRRALDNRINSRGLLDGHWVRSISVRTPKNGSAVHREARTLRHLRRTVRCECRWCGFPLPEYRVHSHRFCSAACAADWRS